MSSHVVGLDELLNDLGVMESNLDECVNDIAKETATMIHKESIENVSGPMNPNFKKSKGGGKSTSRRTLAKKIKYLTSSLRPNSKSLKEQPYPVSVNTGTLKRSIKIKRISSGKYMIFADANIANYAYWVHEGTSRMGARPFMDDAVDKVLNDGEYLNIAASIVEKAIDV